MTSSSPTSTATVGTLLWIGNRDQPVFHPAYQLAEQRASQIAYRPSLSAALAHGATDVCAIVIATEDRSPLDTEQLSTLKKRHVASEWLRLLGPLCAGQRRTDASFFTAGCCDWTEATDAIGRLYPPMQPSSRQSDSHTAIAVITERFADAQPLLEVGQSADVFAIWLRQPSDAVARGINTVWWDDSVAPAAPVSAWQTRLATFGSRVAHHVWITNPVQIDQIDQARAAGIDSVIVKPHRLTALLRTIEHDAKSVASSTPVRKNQAA